VSRTQRFTRIKGEKKGLNLTFKQGTKQDYVIKKQKYKTKNKNMKCAKQTWKQIFIMLTQT